MNRWLTDGVISLMLWCATRGAVAAPDLFKDVAPEAPLFDLRRILFALTICVLVGAAAIVLLRKRLIVARMVGGTAAKRIEVLESARVSGRLTVHYIRVDDFRVLVAADMNGSHITLLPDTERNNERPS